ncbi:hypothetical protein X765_19585 [Mesorhizobium sp. LSHC440B00]|nr:hypothetical protein X765_19585 [Mesorhizobium sp. LSHC440B00]ESX36470.1 hypothetical protein X763_13895 [Mesorhizobium sp. LSHC432A00]ESX41907.1 hypothetical protein X764_13480 [Mesorhizobium sp. LSHC440A00]ESX78373.1 hypothetical protein X757_06830 [Mesorhizobium sp. LSHC414A00]ESZ17747.1 hypothetical protein X735_11585 [Mesorhizobium sp. L2C085B000]ESZ24636.1 hypothetical protein X733_31640 [Mesorhizobium sp. L2C067A000]
MTFAALEQWARQSGPLDVCYPLVLSAWWPRDLRIDLTGMEFTAGRSFSTEVKGSSVYRYVFPTAIHTDCFAS